MNTQNIRTEIVEKLSALGIGKVQPFERYTSNPQKLKEFYQTDKLLCGWFVSRQSVREEQDTSAKNKVITDWKIVGFMGLTDETASEVLFDAKIDAIRQSFRSSDLNSADETGYVQVVSVQPVMFCGILCHSAELSLQTVCKVEIESDHDFNLTDFLTCKTTYETQDLSAEDETNLGGV